MKLLLAALVLMMLHGCSEEDTYVVSTGDVTVEEGQADVPDDVSATDVVDPVQDVTTFDVEQDTEVDVEVDVEEGVDVEDDENVEQLDEDPTSFRSNPDPGSQFFNPEVP